MMFQQIDPRIYELERDIKFLKILIYGTSLAIIVLILVIILQKVTINRLRKKDEPLSPEEKTENKPVNKAASTAETKQARPSSNFAVKSKDLPDPGLVFKYSLADENTTEKLITIGQTEGNIKTYSTEVINDHLNILIRIIDNRRDKDIYNLPDRIDEEYQVDLRRDGRVLIYYPGLEGYRQMGSREKIYIKKEPDAAGDPTFPVVDAKQPIRFRIGDRLNQDDKFTNGYFEFHFFTQDYEVKTTAGIPKTEKYFLIRLYKIYPGYDLSSPNDDGMYPMVDPFTTGR
jgi:hypothetical protein